MNREALIRESRDLVTKVMNLRLPQAEALRDLCESLIRLPDRLDRCTPVQRREFMSFRAANKDGSPVPPWVHPFHPNFTFALATGVGKTRLAGAIMATLWLAGEARAFLILAPRRAVLRRFEDAFNPRFREYIFVDQNLVPEPMVIAGDQVDSPAATGEQGDLFAVGPQIYLLSPQLVSTSERFRGKNEFTGRSLAAVLRSRNDLVVIVDEAHHVGRVAAATTNAWTQAIRDLEPALQLGLTATPREEAGVNVLYNYPLNRALIEAQYTKDVQLLVRQFPDTNLAPEDIDRATIRFALARLALKEAAVRTAGIAPFPDVKPVLVFFARDQSHAEEVGRWLVGDEGLTEREVLVTHSDLAKSEADIERLLSIESVTNPVRVVVNVQELTEGWDVTNVFVVAPLRAMATFQGALQAMGRGLRLPAGRRVGVTEADTLDVVCFGKESLERIIDQATSWSGHPPGAGGVKIGPYTGPQTAPVSVSVPATRVEALRCRVLSVAHHEVEVALEPQALRRLAEMVVEGLRLSEARARVYGVDGQPTFERERFLDAAGMRAVRAAPRLLSDVAHFAPVRSIVERWLSGLRPDATQVAFDPIEVGDEVARLLKESARKQTAGYVPTDEIETVDFPGFKAVCEVAVPANGVLPTISLEQLPAFDPNGQFVVRHPYAGTVTDGGEPWHRALHGAYEFDSRAEAVLACLVDRSDDVDWWVRNQPRRFRLHTPAGTFFPDFVVVLRPLGDARPEVWVVEVKSDFFWEPPESDPRLKADAAARWCEVQGAASGVDWRFGVALESEVERAQSWASLRSRLLISPFLDGAVKRAGVGAAGDRE